MQLADVVTDAIGEEQRRELQRLNIVEEVQVECIETYSVEKRLHTLFLNQLPNTESKLGIVEL